MNILVRRGFARRVIIFGVAMGLLTMLGACRRESPAVSSSSGPTPSPLSGAVTSDQLAEKDLDGALLTAQRYFDHRSSFTGFSAIRAERLELGRSWRGDAGASPGVITINFARDHALIMSTGTSSGGGYCLAVEHKRVVRGTHDAAGARDPSLCGTSAAWPTP